MTIQQMFFGISGALGYLLQRSVRFRASASAYFNRTPASAGNRKTWTWSGWVKRGTLGTRNLIISAEAGGNTNAVVEFNSSDQLRFFQQVSSVNNFELITTQVFRDPSAWYHIVVQLDTTQATSTNRAKLYVNGVQITALSTAVYPAQNFDGSFNNNVVQYIGTWLAAAIYFDGYMTEINFIDGQALTPTSFGEFNSIIGTWQPKSYTGTYGTNGYYLKFSDNTSTTTIGYDYSGNSNNWTANNVSLTAGITYDSMTDVPTLTNATNANYCTLNPLDRNTSTVTLTNGNLNWASGAPSYNQVCRATIAVTSGKWYWEVTPLTNGAWANMGVADALGTLANASRLQPGGWVYQGTTGNKMNNNSSVAYGATYTNNDVIGVALDMDGNTLTFYKNGVSQGVAYSSGFSGNTISPLMQDAANDTTAAINFGQRPFSYTPPTGFLALNTFNLTNSAVINGATQFASTLFTGNGSSQSIVNTVNGVSFQPDFLWAKNRTSAYSNVLIDSIRGATKYIVSNSTAAEATNAQICSAFTSTGFSVGNDLTLNANGTNVVGWQWKAGGSPVTNTAGTISSQVSANTTAGFSIVSWTGNGSASATVGHGLGVAPKMIIVKPRTTVSGWSVFHTSLSANNGLALQATSAQFTAASTTSGILSTSPTSTTFGFVSGSSNVDNVNNNTVPMIAYCFAEILGYSKFGIYTGNGAADGPFVYTGFEPRFVCVKRLNSTGGWTILDSSRDPYNVASKYLFAETSAAEGTVALEDFLSNGFKLRSTSTSVNASGTYIYFAFAENPFKNALAR